MRQVEMLRGDISVGDDLGEFAAWEICNVRDDALRGLVASCTCLSRVRPAKCAGVKMRCVKMRPGGNAHTVNSPGINCNCDLRVCATCEMRWGENAPWENAPWGKCSTLHFFATQCKK